MILTPRQVTGEHWEVRMVSEWPSWARAGNGFWGCRMEHSTGSWPSQILATEPRQLLRDAVPWQRSCSSQPCSGPSSWAPPPRCSWKWPAFISALSLSPFSDVSEALQTSILHWVWFLHIADVGVWVNFSPCHTKGLKVEIVDRFVGKKAVVQLSPDRKESTKVISFSLLLCSGSSGFQEMGFANFP